MCIRDSYKGVTVEKTIQSVTDEDAQNEIDNALANYPVEVDQAAKEGDTVNIDYVGTVSYTHLPIAQFKKPQRSPLRRPYSDKISHKLGLADKCISDT